MEIKKVRHNSFGSREFTTLTFGGNVPSTDWRAILIDGRRVEPVFDSSIEPLSDKITVPGTIDPIEMSAEFVA